MHRARLDGCDSYEGLLRDLAEAKRDATAILEAELGAVPASASARGGRREESKT